MKEAGEALSCFLSSSIERVGDRSGLCKPLIILSFDECHVLGERMWDKNWTIFSELRRTLRELHHEPIFSLFLSTASDFHVINPGISADPSFFITDDNFQTLPPITETCFDVLAYTTKEGVTTLDEVAHDRWMSHLGRPL